MDELLRTAIEGIFPRFMRVAELVDAAITLAYRRGLLDGFLIGAVLVLILTQRARVVVIKGESDATPQ